MTNLITPSQFLSAFERQWHEDSTEYNRRKEAFAYEKLWTQYMLGSEPPGFLRRVASRLGLKCYGEFYKLDLVYVSGTDLFREDLCYPSLLPVIIEHEQFNNVEEEMWKLIFWRSPLKVLISCDWNEDEKTTHRRNWWTDKLKALSEMLATANRDYPETEMTEYLFIIGNREDVQSDIKWRWADTTLKLNSFCLN